MKTKKTMIIVCCIIICFAVFGVVIYVMSATNNPIFLRNKILANCNSFCKSWNMGRPEIDENERKIEIGFSRILSDGRRTYEGDAANTALACKEISDYLFSDRFHFKKEGYQIGFVFSDNKQFQLEVQNVEPDMRNIYLKLPDEDLIPNNRYSEWYPQTETLDVYNIDDDVIELIQNLPHLKCIRTGPDLTDDQREKILEICPDVEIESGLYVYHEAKFR